MSLKTDIYNAVNSIVEGNMTVEETSNVPDIDDSNLTFGLRGKRFKCICFNIDMRGSTNILEKHNANVVIKIHKAFFIAVLKIVKSLGGEVRSFNGDSLLAFFVGDDSSAIEAAIKAAMQVKYILISDNDSLKNKIKIKYDTDIDIGIGLDIGSVTTAKVGIQGDNNRDLIWIGSNVNRAVKISDTRKSSYNIGVSERLYNRLTNNVKYHNNVNMWQQSNFSYNGINEMMFITSYYWTV